MTSSSSSEPTIDARGATGVAVASMVGAASSYLVLVIAVRALTPQSNAEFLTFWSALFWLFGTLGGVQHEATRAVAHRRSEPDARPGARVLTVGLSVGAGAALLVGASSLLWGESLLGADWPWLVGALAIGGIAFAGHSAWCGILSGEGAWSVYSRLVGAEAGVRLVLVLVVAVLGAHALGIELAAAASAATWAVLAIVDPGLRSRRDVRADVRARAMLGNIGQTVLASAASTGLVVGFTVLLRATTQGAEFTGATAFVLAITLTRAPLLLPLQAYQGVAIAHVVAHRNRGAAALGPIAAAVVGVGAVAAVAAWWLGPLAMRVLFGPEYDVPGLIIGLLTVGAACLALLTLAGATVLALGHHRAYATGWVAAFLVSVAVLLLPGSIEARGAAALMAGPLVGCAVHASALARHARSAG